MNIFLKFEGQTLIVSQQQLYSLIAINQGKVLLVANGKICTKNMVFNNNQTIYAHIPLLGGKGGFGAKLKTEGGKKVRPNDNMYSRDLQGRPVAYANMTKQYEQYYKKKVQQDQRVQKQLADFKVIKNTYKQDYASTRLDSTYNAKIQENQKRLKDAMKIGMKKYLEKKKQQTQQKQEKDQQNNEQEQNQEQRQKRQYFEEFIDQQNEKDQKQQQEQKQQKIQFKQKNENDQIDIIPIKRNIPKQIKQQENQQRPKKMIKPNQQAKENKFIKQAEKSEKPETSALKFSSARQKLKSLFKK